jgi:hypothetical protein
MDLLIVIYSSTVTIPALDYVLLWRINDRTDSLNEIVMVTLGWMSYSLTTRDSHPDRRILLRRFLS